MPDVITDNIDLWTSALLTKSTAGRGSNGKLEAYGIKKLRELILELAVRGKLVFQDSNDKPASVLLVEISKERNRLAKEGKIKKPKELSEISEEEKPFDLPIGWEYVRLNDLGEWGAGATPSRGRHDYYGGEIPWFKSGELVDDYISESEERVTELALKETSLRYNKPGDVLIAMYGATIGKTSILNVAATTNQAVCACTPFTGFANIFLLTLLKAYKSRFVGQGAGGAQPNISREKIIATVIALPPISEQHRIVAKVNELMALCDQLEKQQTNNIEAHQALAEALLSTLTNVESQQELTEAWTRIADHFDTLFTTEHSIDQLKQTILQLAVMGKLMPQDPDDEPAAVLLERICKEKEELANKGKIKKSNALPVIDEGEKLFILPDTWRWVRFGELIQSFANGLYKKESFYDDSGVISLRMYNIQNGIIEFSDLRRVNVTDEELIQYALEPGDLLFNRVNSKELVGKTAIIPEYSEPLLYESMNMRAKPYKKQLASEYLNLFMQSEIAKSILRSHAKEAISQASINQGQISSLPVPLPPKAEQYRIVAKVDELMALCETLKSQLSDAQTTQLHLADTIVEQAMA